MSEQAQEQAPTAHEERLEALGAAESTAARRAAARAAGAAKIKAACALYDSMGSELATVQAEVRRIALAYLPKAIKRTARVAAGEIKAPESVRLAATSLLAGAAQVSLEAIPGASSKPVAEMTLGEIDETLRTLLERSRDAQAIESTSLLLPNSGSESEPAGPEGGAQAAEVSAHPLAGGSSGEG